MDCRFLLPVSSLVCLGENFILISCLLPTLSFWFCIWCLGCIRSSGLSRFYCVWLNVLPLKEPFQSKTNWWSVITLSNIIIGVASWSPIILCIIFSHVYGRYSMCLCTVFRFVILVLASSTCFVILIWTYVALLLPLLFFWRLWVAIWLDHPCLQHPRWPVCFKIKHIW